MPRRANGPRRADGINRLGGIDLVLAKACLALSRTRWPYANAAFVTVSELWPYAGRRPDAGFLFSREEAGRCRQLKRSVGLIRTYRREARHLETVLVSAAKSRVRPRLDTAVLPA